MFESQVKIKVDLLADSKWKRLLNYIECTVSVRAVDDVYVIRGMVI